MFDLSKKKAVVVILSGIVLAGLIYFIYELRPVYGISKTEFKIAQGMGIREIAANLYSQNLIHSKTAFEIYGILTAKSRSLKPGEYILNGSISASDLIKIFSGGPEEISVIIRPGMTLKEIDNLLYSDGIIPENGLENYNLTNLKTEFSFLENNNLEGFLFPDTYKFFPASDPGDILKKLLKNFQQKAYPDLSQSKNPYQTLILASILEKEIIDPNEQKIAAGILEKRLKINMPLQVDSSVIYAVCRGKYSNCPPLSSSDYQTNSPFNTYKFKGLPPAPISNPGLQAIIAAANPQKSDYLYYLSDPKTKKTIFSRTLEEQNKNRVNYLNL